MENTARVALSESKCQTSARTEHLMTLCKVRLSDGAIDPQDFDKVCSLPIGASSFVHAASDLSFSPNPNDIITPVLASVKSALTSAANTPTVKTFVLTSSSTAASAARPNEKFHVDASLWNEADIKAAWAPAPYEQSRAWAVYGASKAQGEQALWDFVKTAKPSFSANAILPNANFGPVIEPKHQSASTAGWIRSIYAGKFDTVKNFPPRE